jgi:hypothetical protein
MRAGSEHTIESQANMIPSSPEHPVPGLYPWFREHGTHLIHPEDLDAVERLIPFWRVFFCEGECDGYLVLRYRDRVYRVRPDFFTPIGNLPFGFGETVLVHGSVPPKIGVTREIGWHFGRKAAYYNLSFGTRKSTRWYFPEELTKP